MSDVERFQHKLRDFNLSGAGTTAGVTADEAAVTGHQHVLTHLSFSGDAAALVTVESAAGTILWRRRFAAAFSDSTTFPTGLRGASGQLLRLKVSASTANSEISGAGYSILHS